MLHQSLFIIGSISKQDTQIVPAPIEDTVYEYIFAVDTIKDDIVSCSKEPVAALNIGNGRKSRADQRVVTQNTDDRRNFLTVEMAADVLLSSSAIYCLISAISSWAFFEICRSFTGNSEMFLYGLQG